MQFTHIATIFSQTLFCFLQFHVTTRLKAHTIQHLLNSFVSPDSRKIVPVDKENAKKDAGLPPVRVVLQMSTSDMSQFKRTLNNGHSIDSPARELGAQDHTWISRATSKLRRIKSGFSVLNEIQCTDGVLLQVCGTCLLLLCCIVKLEEGIDHSYFLLICSDYVRLKLELTDSNHYSG